jgi:hypothetical protein
MFFGLNRYYVHWSKKVLMLFKKRGMKTEKKAGFDKNEKKRTRQKIGATRV